MSSTAHEADDLRYGAPGREVSVVAIRQYSVGWAVSPSAPTDEEVSADRIGILEMRVGALLSADTRVSEKSGHGPRYHIRTRARGSTYSRCPGTTSKASYHASRLRTVSNRYISGAWSVASCARMAVSFIFVPKA